MFVYMLRRRVDMLIFLVFYAITLIVYFESRYSGFVTDFIGFEMNYDKCGFLHYYDCASNPNFRYLQHAFSYVLYKYIGSDTLIWYVLYALAHSITAFLCYKVFFKLIDNFDKNKSKFFAFFIALLFLVSPYQAEVVVWRVCIQYCTISICLLMSILLYLKDLENQHWIYPVLVVCLFVIGLLSLEQIVVMPYFLLLISLFYAIRYQTYSKFKRFILKYLIPQNLLIATYFCMSKILYGKWIMHYGKSSYDGFLSLKTIAKVYLYFLKYVLLVRYWSYDSKTALFGFIESNTVTIILTIALIVGVIFLIKWFIKGSVYSGLLLLFIGLYILSLLPVIQLYFSTLLYGENDRLGYLSSVFIFGIIILLLSKLNTRIFIGSTVLLIVLNLFYTLNMSHYWKRSTQIYNAYLHNFDAYNYQNVYLLGIPDNYQGIWMMRMYGNNSGFKEALQYRLKKPYYGNMYDVLMFNQVSFEDGMKVEKRNDSTLYVNFTHYGSWFWNQGIGATNYETKQYNVQIEQYGYTVTFKKIDNSNSIILYPDKLKWKEFKF